MNILFLTASTGGGHIKAAQALMEHMEKNVPGCRTVLVDALKYINPIADRLIAGTYLQTIKKAPNIYGKLYRLSEKSEAITDLVKAINNRLAPGLTRIFGNDPPDAIICTHTIPLQMVSYLKRNGITDIPVIGIVTDYTSHYFWKLNEPDALIVAHERIKSDMARIGIDENRIYAYGIPVSGRFKENCSRYDEPVYARTKKQTILLMGGSLGLCSMRDVFTSLLEIDYDIRIIAVTGHNFKLQTELNKLSDDSGKEVRVLGYTDDIYNLMENADIIITKPGGVTISEALIKKLPIFIMDPIPGQEERNAAFLIETGAARRLPEGKNLNSAISSILDNPMMLRWMSESAGKLAKLNACEDITRLVTRMIWKDESMIHKDTIFIPSANSRIHLGNRKISSM